MKMYRSWHSAALSEGPRRVWKRDDTMVKNAQRREVATLQYVHEIMARLVDGVYARDRGVPNHERYWLDIDYTEMDINECEFGDADAREKISDREIPLRLMVFKRRGSGGGEYLQKEDDIKDPVKVQAPKYVVAIRGTLINWSGTLIDRKGWSDLKADLHILFQTICIINGLNEPVKNIIQGLYRKCNGDGEVWVTGHSLGAMLGEGATRLLADKEDIVLQAHLFNLPNVSLRTLFKEFTLRSARGFDNFVSRFGFVGELAGGLAVGSGRVLTSVGDGAMTAMSKLLFPSAWTRAVESNDRLMKRHFCPHIYVNPKDVICNDYIRQFNMKSENRPAISNTTGVLQYLLGEEACGCYRIHRAHLHINNWAEGEIEAHKLHQWYLYAPVEFRSKLI
ncbi:hypothetical protein R1sor_003871 [Riccia sorocarpa]|uniref:Fungal lipase-like domain-containing protein n=1 Tax=Riccia sorocarpa TaxID=122646 RepID=A0ABD3H914_9MARC